MLLTWVHWLEGKWKPKPLLVAFQSQSSLHIKSHVLNETILKLLLSFQKRTSTQVTCPAHRKICIFRHDSPDTTCQLSLWVAEVLYMSRPCNGYQHAVCIVFTYIFSQPTTQIALSVFLSLWRPNVILAVGDTLGQCWLIGVRVGFWLAYNQLPTLA